MFIYTHVHTYIHIHYVGLLSIHYIHSRRLYTQKSPILTEKNPTYIGKRPDTPHVHCVGLLSITYIHRVRLVSRHYIHREYIIYTLSIHIHGAQQYTRG